MGKKRRTNLVQNNDALMFLMFNEHFSKIQNDSAEHPVMRNHYCSNSHPSIRTIRNNCPNIKSFNFQLISPAEVQQVLGKRDPNKATGHDGIPAKILRDCSKELALPLANLFNTSIVFERFPSDWKLAELCPVFKKDDSSNISLSAWCRCTRLFLDICFLILMFYRKRVGTIITR